ncbi:MAG: DsrE family protein [Betaproteobacteria bacterium]|nr:DsrE family protein [Betaproteobacteria bacterium]
MLQNKITGLALAGMLAVMGFAQAANAAEKVKEKVVLQVSDDSPKTWNQALNVVGNLKRNLGKNNVEIELVAFGDGIKMLSMDSEVGNRIEEALTGGDARILACENSMKRFSLQKAHMLHGIDYVQTGVIKIINRQHEGWAVIRP